MVDYVNLSLNGVRYNQDPQIAGMKRFDIARFLFARDGYFDAASSYLIQNLPSLPMVGYYIIVDTPFRPDTISFDIWGDTQYWWMVMLYNNIIDIRNLPQLTRLNYFSLSDLDLMFSKMIAAMGSNPRG
jgi:hypothetical protein